MSDMAKKICETLDIKEVLRFYGVHLNSRGFAKCPFHNEKTASFTTHKNRFKCFGCGESGSIIDFVMKYHGIGFRQAIIKINADFNLGLTTRKPTRKERMEKAENRRIEESFMRYKEILHRRYLRACKLHSVLFRLMCEEEHPLPELVEYVNELGACLDTFDDFGIIRRYDFGQ